jgi:hypothetical protein
VLLAAATSCMVVALLCVTGGIGGPERPVLLYALGFAMVGNVLLVALIWIGSGWWRLAGLVLMAPTMWVVGTFLRRAAQVFGP